MSTIEASRVLAPVGMTPDPWDTDETFVAEARRERERIEGRVAALRALADFVIDRNMPAPFLDIGYTFGSDREDGDRVVATWYVSAESARALVKALGGTFDAPAVKDVNESSGYLRVTRRLPDVPLTLRVTVTGTVCEMVDTGRTETVEVEKVVEPAKVEKVTEERPIFERRCPESLLALADVEDAGSDAA